jgi:hypothetical protein
LPTVKFLLRAVIYESTGSDISASQMDAHKFQPESRTSRPPRYRYG